MKRAAVLLVSSIALSTAAQANDFQLVYAGLNFPTELGNMEFDLAGVGISYHITPHLSFTNQLMKGFGAQRVGMTIPVEVAPGTFVDAPFSFDVAVDWAWQSALVYGYEFHQDFEWVFSLTAANLELTTKPSMKAGLLDVDNIQQTYYGTGLEWDVSPAQKVSVIYQLSDSDDYNLVSAFYEHEFQETYGVRALYSYSPNAHQSSAYQLQLYKNF